MKDFMKVTAKREKAGHMRFAVLMLVALLATAMPFSVFAETYDVVINNGRVMDPETNFDGVRNAGMGAIPTTGMPYVLVNGVVVVKDSKVQKVFPGKPIRFPVLASGRLDQISIEPRIFDPNQ